MSTKEEDESPQGTAVDFIFRTMIARASAPGKRQIRPKNVDDLLHADIQELGSDEDPDFDVSKDKHHNESDVSIEEDEEEEDADKGSGSEDNDKGSMDGNAEDSEDEDDVSYDAAKDPRNVSSDDDSGDTSGGSGSSSDSSDDDEEGDAQSPVQKRSALRETLQKLNDEDYAPLKKKRKRPRKAGGVKAKKDSTPAKKKKTSATAKGRKGALVAVSKAKRVLGKKGALVGKKTGAALKEKERLKLKKKKKFGEGSIMNMLFGTNKGLQDNRQQILQSQLHQPICSACLGKSSDALNEIVECDSCGITVHEACYGLSDTLSVSSGTGSSCSTEPWFCDACRTGAKNISCELCPMPGGLFKETTAGRWVHLVCALYTPGVVITEMGLPSLFEIPYTKWGANPCSLCSDVRFSRSGICIGCDAGLCKTYLHATCAQKHGLLSDPLLHYTGNEMEADPYFAACKLHTNRETAKRRSKCYSILQEQLRIKHLQKSSKDLTPEEIAIQERIARKLERIRFKVAVKQAHNPLMSLSSKPPAPLTASNLNELNSTTGGTSDLLPFPLPHHWREGNKKTRMLPTSAGTAVSFLRKAALMGLDIKAMELEDKHTRIVASVKKKWNVLPSLGVEFAAYYSDRENRINKLTDQCETLGKENQKLNEQQVEMQNTYHRECVHDCLFSEDNASLRQNIMNLTSAVKTLTSPGNKKLLGALHKMEADVAIISPPARKRSPSNMKGRSSVSPTKAVGVKKSKVTATVTSGASPARRVGGIEIKVCSVCDKTDQQPFIIRCDNCKKLYHLRCLDPPLTRMPKRSKLCGWMCSDCGEEELDGEEPEVDTEAPRTLRGRTKIRKPGKYRHSTDSREGGVKVKKISVKSELLSPVSDASSNALASPNSSALINGVPKMKKPTVKRNSSESPSKRSVSSSLGVISPTSLNASITINSTFATPTSEPFDVTSSAEGLVVSKPKRKYVRKKSLNKENPENANNVEQPFADGISTDAVPKKRKVYKPKKLKVSVPDGSTAEPVNIDTSQNDGQISTYDFVSPTSEGKVKKPRKKSDVPKMKKTPGLKRTPKSKSGESPSFSSSPSVPNGIDSELSLSKTIVKKARKRIRISKAVVLAADYNAIPSDESFSPVKKAKKMNRRSIAELQKNMMAAASLAVIKNADPNAITPLLIPNGKPKGLKRPRKSSIEKGGVTTSKKKKASPIASNPSLAGTGTNSTANHEDDIINAVANGTVESYAAGLGGDETPKNGLSHTQARNSLPDGVLMQGVAPSNSSWAESKSPEEHSIMKGHAMGINTSGGETVTVNASDLLDMIPTSASNSVTVGLALGVPTIGGLSGYSPGFYSTKSSDSDPPSMSSGSTQPSGSGNGSSSIDGEKLGSPVWNQTQTSLVSSQGQSSSDNVIKLHYQPEDAPSVSSNSANTGTVSSTTAVAAIPSYAPVTPSVVASPAVSPYAPSNPPVLMEGFGTCSKCKMGESKKNMVTCDKCAQDFHFMCLDPPLKWSPRRRNYAWYCSVCDDPIAGVVLPAGQKQTQLQFQQEPRKEPTPAPPPSHALVYLSSDAVLKNILKNFKPSSS